MEQLRQRSDQVFDRINTYPGEGFRNHCLRLADYAGLHANHMGIELDADLAHAAAMLHDLGLLLRPEPGTDYVDRSWALAYRELDVTRMDPETQRVLEQSLRFNHSMRPMEGLVPQAEAFRRAVFTEHTHGIRRYGLGRQHVREVSRDHVQGNFRRVLADFFWKTVVFEPRTIPSIFLPDRSALQTMQPAPEAPRLAKIS